MPGDGPARIVAIDPYGHAVSLDGHAMVHLARALRQHFQQCHRNGIPLPQDLRKLAAALALDGAFVRHGGRERDRPPTAGHREVAMTYQEAAQHHRVSTRTLRRWRAQGLIRGVGRRLIVEVPDDFPAA